MNRMQRSARATALGILVAAAPLAAQTPEPDGIPPELVQAIFEFFNRSGTIRMTGESRIASGSEVVGDVAVLGGPLQLAGRVRGDVVVLNGDARLEPGAEVLGDLTVVGGAVSGRDSAVVTGTVRAYGELLRFRIEGGRVEPAEPADEPGISTGRDFGFGRTDLTIAAHSGYNRVEGLPVVAGPRFETRASNPTRAEALLIYRTAAGLDPDADELGYVLRLEQFVGGRNVARLGVTLHSEIVPIEAWGLRDRENSLSTFLLHRDYRDHYEREGWSVYFRIAPPRGRHDFVLGYRDERHRSTPPREPWTVIDDSDPWRPQPRVAEGTLRSLYARIGYDTRNEGIDPTTGWWVRAELERGLGGTLARVDTDIVCVTVPCPATVSEPVETEFATAFVDVRRYARMSPDSRLALRVVAATSLNDRPLPPQRQHALGGEGSLPGYRLFAFDCGARGAGTLPSGLLPYYGCDRFALLQLEYRTAFPFGHGWGRKLGWDIDLGERPGWTVFFDAGRAWTEQTALDGRSGGMDDFAVDVGAGLRLGRLGAYWAVPLSGHDDGVNFFIRIGARF